MRKRLRCPRGWGTCAPSPGEGCRQDNSMNMEDQKTFIDLAADLGYENILIDAGWDQNIGYDRMPELLGYAREKG